MLNNNTELDIRNLVVSFRTNKGIVHAVRDISLSLNKGETLAIVGESGSGKSVSAKAILGIEAPNAIIEDGEILYHGQNLLTFTEEEFNHIRGNKITMVFQDPMSSLDPIVKIGPQMTEATLLNGKTSQKLARKELDQRLKNLQICFDEAGLPKAETAKEIATFRKFINLGSKELSAYNTATEYADSVCFDIVQLKNDLLEAEKHPIVEELKNLQAKIGRVYYQYFIKEDDAELNRLAKFLEEATVKFGAEKSNASQISMILDDISRYLTAKLAVESPNFFTLGYTLMAYGKEGVDFTNVEAMNHKLRETIDNEFMIKFIEHIAAAVKAERSRSRKESDVADAEAEVAQKLFAEEEWNIVACRREVKKLCALVDAADNRIALHKDRAIYTLRHTLQEAVASYRKTPHAAQTNAKGALKDLRDLYASFAAEDKDYDEAHELTAAAVALIDHFKELSADAVHKITKQMAYDKAIRIMEEVGIREPRKRFEQYPFEFSGGMRQRIVIAIAIAANPDLLICDEPTTALDVTIQAQILELINNLKKKRNMSVIFITHDLGVVANVADKIAVMYAGKIVEQGTAEDIFYHPAHPYTWALLASMPDLDTKETLEAIPGTPPNMIYPPKGDAFADRNKYAMAIDYEEQPPLFKISDTHYAATWLLHPDAPKVEPPKTVTDRIARMKAKNEKNAKGAQNV